VEETNMHETTSKDLRSLALGLTALAWLIGAGSAAAQEGSEVPRPAAGFSLELSGAAVGIDGFDQTRAAIGLRPRWCTPNRPWCVWVDFCRIFPPWRDPWPGRLRRDVPISDLDVGPGWLLAPALEYTFQSEARVRPAVYLGAGIERVEGRTTDLGERGSYRIDTMDNPVVTYGFNLAYDLSPRTTLRFQVGATTAFVDDMEIRGSDGRRFPVEGGSVTNGVVGLSLSYSFGRRCQ
jgi:hypothetical protein